MIIGYDESTFGKKGQIRSKTVCYVKCDNCGEKEWSTAYSNRKRRDYDYCQSCKNRLGISGMKGKKFSEETLKLFRDGRNAGENNPSKRKDVRAKISKALKGRDVPWLVGKKRPDHAKKMSQHMREIWSTDNEYTEKAIERLAKVRKNLKAGHSKLHTKFKQYMMQNNFSGFKSEEKIGRYIVDEVNYEKKIIVEIYGDYWHCNPKFYSADDKIKFPGRECVVKEIWKKDKRRVKKLENLGYRVIIIWENDIRYHLKDVKEVLRNVYC